MKDTAIQEKLFKKAALLGPLFITDISYAELNLLMKKHELLSELYNVRLFDLFNFTSELITELQIQSIVRWSLTQIPRELTNDPVTVKQAIIDGLLRTKSQDPKQLRMKFIIARQKPKQSLDEYLQFIVKKYTELLMLGIIISNEELFDVLTNLYKSTDIANMCSTLRTTTATEYINTCLRHGILNKAIKSDHHQTRKDDSKQTTKRNLKENEKKKEKKVTYLCHRCGNSSCTDITKCFAINITCRSCGVKGHLEKVCKKKSKTKENKEEKNTCEVKAITVDDDEYFSSEAS